MQAKGAVDFPDVFTYTSRMTFIMTLTIFGACIAAMAIGLIINKKRLIKGCSVDPDDCSCLREGKDPAKCDQ